MSGVEAEARAAEPASGPLAGVRVLDLTSVVMGPFATHILGALGAAVTKLESLEGDNMRHVVPQAHAGMGHVFLHANRGKRSIALDLKRPAALDAVRGALSRFDVLVCNVRPQAMTRLGLGYDDCARINPRLVYVSTTGYAEGGPSAGRPAYDDLIQGAAGIPWLTAAHGGGEPRYLPSMIADRLSGLHAVYAVTAALYARERSGRGQFVELAMFEALAQTILGDHLAGASWDPPAGASGYARMMTEWRRPYRTADGHLCVLVYNDGHWKRFFAAIGESERFAREPMFASIASRSANIDCVYAFVAARLAERSTAEWMELLVAADIPFAPVNSIDDLVADPQLAASGLLDIEDHPSEGRLRRIGQPTRWGGTPLGTPAPAPRLGQHTREVLAEWGLAPEAIEALVASGAARGDPG